MIKVSVIIPVYNTEKFLPQCLDSVIGQTLKEIEIICINDGSTDNSLSVLELQQKSLEIAEKSMKLAEDSHIISKQANKKSSISNWIALISTIIALIALFK